MIQTQITKQETQQIVSTTRSQIFAIAPELQVFVKQTSFDDYDGTLQLPPTNPKGSNHVSVKCDHVKNVCNCLDHTFRNVMCGHICAAKIVLNLKRCMN